MLAVVTGTLDAPSETFIRAHATGLAPGRTVALVARECGACPDVPRVVLPSPVRAGMPWPVRKLLGMSEWLRTGARSCADVRQEAFLVRELKRHGVDVVLAEYGPTGCFVRRACRRAGVRLFVHFHGYDATMLARQAFWRREYLRLWPQVAGVICPSQYVRRCVERLGCPPGRIHVVPCGVDPDRFGPADEARREDGLVAAVGRLVEKKAPHLAIRAFGLVAGRFPRARLEMVGAGPLEDLCRMTIRELGLEGRVVLHGARDHGFVADLMRRAAVFAQHSITARTGDAEGLPVSILEAMAAGLPVVATFHSGIPEAVADGETGLLVPEGDVEGMARHLAALLADPARARRMGEAGRRRVLEHFTLERSLARLRGVLGLGGPQ